MKPTAHDFGDYERATLLFKCAILLLNATAFKILDLGMAADIFNKPVEKAKFIHMRDYMTNVHFTLRGSVEDAMVCAVGASHRMMSNLLRRL